MARLLKRKRGVGFIAPSGQVLDAGELDRAISYFEARGYRVVCPQPVRRSHQRFAGTDAQRLQALHAMLTHADVDVVMAVRGGYGLSRLLDQIDYAKLAASGKTIVGHSDFTAFNAAAYAQAKLVTWCGPTACFDFGAETVSPFTETHFFAMLEHTSHRVEVPTQNPYRDAWSGRLWGGNLSLIAHLVGTPYLPRINGGILFVEDISEHPYRIERMIYQLLHAGVLARQKVLVLGDFSNYRLGENDNGYDFAEMVAHLRARLPIPVVTGLPFGHCRDKLTLPFGGWADFEVQKSAFSLTLSHYQAG